MLAIFIINRTLRLPSIQYATGTSACITILLSEISSELCEDCSSLELTTLILFHSHFVLLLSFFTISPDLLLLSHRIFRRRCRLSISPESPLTHYETYSSLLPTSKRLRSTLFLQSVGLHFACALPPAIAYLHAAVGYFAQQHIPRAINLWMGLHAPGENKNVKYRATQGRDSVKRLNEGMSEEVDALAAGEEEMVRGALRSFDWYNATEGAESFDGTHYSYQVSSFFISVVLSFLALSCDIRIIKHLSKATPDQSPLLHSQGEYGESPNSAEPARFDLGRNCSSRRIGSKCVGDVRRGIGCCTLNVTQLRCRGI